MSWRTRREMKLVSQGLESVVMLKEMAEIPGKYRLTVHERIVGGIPTRVSEQIFDHPEGIDAFKAACVEYVVLDYRHPEPANPRIAHRFDDVGDEHDVDHRIPGLTITAEVERS